MTDLERMYELMALMSACDQRAAAEVRAGRLRAAVYPIRGMEAVCAALGLVLERNDMIFSTYRNLGDAIAKGIPLVDIVAEAYGRVDGTSKGKGGAMHLADTSVGFMGTTGVVGGGLPIAVGLAVAAQLEGQEQVVAVTFGDGATSIGGAHEAFNLAALWRLPLVFVCQNNMWGEHTPLHEYAANPDLAARARAYGMEAITVDGFDAIATLEALRSAVEAARRGDGPVFVEAQTYRLAAHTAAGDTGYMPAAELAAGMDRDPTPAMRRLLDETAAAAIDARVCAAIDTAFEVAAASAWPGDEELFLDVFADVAAIPGRVR